MTVALLYSLKSGRLIPPVPFCTLFHRVVYFSHIELHEQLNILEINFSSVVSFAIILSHFEGCIFILLIDKNINQWNKMKSPEIHTPMDSLSLTKEAKMHNGENTVSSTTQA